MKSPFTLRDTPSGQDTFYGIYAGYLDHSDSGFGRFYGTEQAIMALHSGNYVAFQGADEKYGIVETKAALNLIRSYLWRKEHRDGPSLLVTEALLNDDLIDIAFKAHPRARPPMIRSFGSFVREANALTLIHKAEQTLDNLYFLFERGQLAGSIPYADIDNPRGRVAAEDINFRPGGNEDGSTYGSDEKSAQFVYEYLYTGGFMRWKDRQHITAKGFDIVEGLRRGASTESQTVFLVRRWDRELDKILVPACEIAKNALGVPIEAVWAKEHNEKIDERVFRSLRQAVAVVVDLTPDREDKGDRINVGIEAGYAMALGKPIIAIRQTPIDSDSKWHHTRPFDIVTLSCFDYGREATFDVIQELAEKLIARVGLAVDLQRRPLAG